MLRIKRTKGGLTHYATAVTPRGTVDGWSRDPAKAVAVTEGVARRVALYYKGRANTGEFAVEPVGVTAASAIDAVATKDAVGAAEFAALQAECKRLRAASAELREEADAADAARTDAVRRADEATRRALELEEALAEMSNRSATAAARVADLEAKVAELEQMLTAPTEQQPPAPSEQPKQGKKK